MTKRKLMMKKKLDSPINSIDVSRQNVIAAGQKNGIVNLY